jgi:hypothetical protein
MERRGQYAFVGDEAPRRQNSHFVRYRICCDRQQRSRRRQRGRYSGIRDETPLRSNEPKGVFPSITILFSDGYYNLRGWGNVLGAMQCPLQQSRTFSEAAILYWPAALGALFRGDILGAVIVGDDDTPRITFLRV